MSGSSNIPALTTFTSGDIVISVVGDGDGSGTYGDNQAAPITLEEIDPETGEIVAELTLPQTTTVSAGGVTENAISGEYGSSSEGSLELAGNGQSLVIAGYGVNADTFNEGGAAVYGTAALAQSTSIQGGEYTAVPRVIADIGVDGTVDTSTALYNVFNTNNPRSVATINGSTFYISGQGVKGDTTQGVFVAQDGASSATSIDDANDTRTVEIYNGRLYVSEDSTQPSGTGTSNIASFGSTLPTSTTAPAALPGISQSITLTAVQENSLNSSAVGTKVDLSPENYFFANATTLYVADGGQPKEGTVGDGGLQKWTLNPATGIWTLDYTLSAGLNLVDNSSVSSNTSGTTGLLGLTGVLNANGTVTFYATNSTIGDLDQTYLYTITDTVSATTPAPGESFTVVETAAADTNIRGIALAPSAPTSTTISAGQTTSGGLTISNGSTLNVLSGGTASAVVILSGGVAYVSGTDTGSMIVEGGSETVYGTAIGDEIYGVQIVSGAVSGESVYDGGVLDLAVAGASASGTTVNISGSLDIGANAAATNTVINGGTVVLQSPQAKLAGAVTFAGAGTIAETAIVSAGYGDLATISGFGAGDVIDMALIGSGATLSSAVVSGNTVETVTSGGLSESFIFAGQYSSGTFELIPDGNGGVELAVAPVSVTSSTTVSSGVTSEDAVIENGGTVTVLSGGNLISASILSGGSATISGTDTATTISAGGSELVFGTANGDQIYGTQIVSSSTTSAIGSVAGETVFNGGVVDLYIKGAVASGTVLDTGASLNISGNATAENTVINGGTILLESGKAALGGAVTFAGSGAIVESVQVSATSSSGDLATISGFGAGDVIDLSYITSGATLSSAVVSGNTVETVTSGSVSESFIFAGSSYAPGHFVLSQTTSGAELTVSTTLVSSSTNTLTIPSGQSTPPGYVVSGGYTLDVLSGGAASGVTVLSGGVANFAGTDSGTVISSGGTAVITGVETSATILAGGSATLLGSATGDQIYGTQLVSAATAVVTGETVFSGGNLNLFLKGAVASTTTVKSGGSLNINGNATALNTVIDGGALVLESPKATFSDALTFTGAGQIDETAIISAGYGDLATISGFGAGDIIDLSAIGSGATLTSTTSAGNTVLTISGGSAEGSGVTESFIFAGTGGSFTLLADGSGTGEEIEAPCYCTGTKILGMNGEIAVEDIRPGDVLVTVREDGPSSRKVVWTGLRHIDLTRHPEPKLARPVCILAGAIAPGVPERNLRVSPHHAIYLDNLLFEAQALINGNTIFQEHSVQQVTYHHIELEAHDIILAEGLAAESYLDTGNRAMFGNESVTNLHPHFKPVPGAAFCVPLVLEGAPLVAVREKLEARANGLMRPSASRSMRYA